MCYCRICGDERGTEYRPAQRQTLCESCWRDTPRKVSRAEFDRAYWGSDDEPCAATKREFYSDYLASASTLEDYIRSTTSAA